MNGAQRTVRAARVGIEELVASNGREKSVDHAAGLVRIDDVHLDVADATQVDVAKRRATATRHIRVSLRASGRRRKIHALLQLQPARTGASCERGRCNRKGENDAETQRSSRFVFS